MRKKGASTFAWEHLLSILLAALIVAFLWNSSPVQSIFKIFFGGGEEQETISNFNELAEVLKVSLPESRTHLSKIHLFYISNKYIIVAFNKDNEGSLDECDPEPVPRPMVPECLNSACICLYKENEGWTGFLGSDDDFVNNRPIACKKIDTDEIFTLDYYDIVQKKPRYSAEGRVYKNIIGPKAQVASEWYKMTKDEYARLFIYGQCEDFQPDENLGPQRLFIEKVYDSNINKTLTFIAEKSVSARYEERFLNRTG